MRDAVGRFVPGFSGNPGGRPRGATALREQVQAMTPQLADTLMALAFDKRVSPAARIRAISVLLDRGFGRPMPEQSAPAVVDISKLSDAELDELIAQGEEEERLDAEEDAEAAKR